MSNHKKKYVAVRIKAKGEGLSYDWQYQTPDDRKWKSFPTDNGTAEIRLPITDSIYEGAQVRCVVTDKNGRSLISNASEIPGKKTIKIIEQPEDKVSPGINKSVTVSVTATGEMLTYEWEYQWNGENIWNKFEYGNGGPLIRIPMSSPKYDGIKVHCLISDDEDNIVVSRTAVLNFEELENVRITRQPEDAVSEGLKMPVKAVVAADGVSLSYHWEYQWADSENWESFIYGNGFETISVPMTSARYDGIKVRCIVSDQHGSNVTSEVAVMTFA